MSNNKSSSQKTEKPNSRIPENLQIAILNNKTAIIVAILGLIGTITAAIIISISESKKNNPSLIVSPTQTLVANPPSLSSGDICIDSSRYGFDCGQSGWDKSSFYKDQAVQSVATTQFINENNIASTVLAITIDFTGSIEERKEQYRISGEAQVDLNGFPPTGYETKPVDLHGHTVVAWVWASEGATGDPNSMNGIQLFVKDKNDKNCYGEWNNISQEENWFRVLWQEDNARLCDTGFDSTKPKFLGIKVAMGDKSIKIYNAPLIVYIDDIDWE